MESLKDGLETRERALTQHYRNFIKYMYTSSTRTSRGRKFPVYKKNINL